MVCCGWIPKVWTRSDDDSKRCIAISALVILVLAIVILTATLLGLCVNIKVGQNNYMVTWNKYTTTVSGVREQGTYTLLPGDNQITFTRTLQNINIGDITCLSQDKITLVLTISAQYQYVKDQIVPVILYQYSNEGNYQNFFINLVTSSIISTCGQYTAEDYYDFRGTIEVQIFNQLVYDVNNATSAVDIQFLQLKNIAFPDDFSTIITQKQIVQQQEITELNARTSLLIEANTTLLASQKQAAVYLINSNQTTSVILNQAVATQNIVLTTWQQRSVAYSSIKNALGLDDSAFIQYLRANVLQSSITPVVQL